MSSISRKAAFKGALYKRLEDKAEQENIKAITDFVLNDKGMGPALSAIIISSKIYYESGTFQRFQCIDKMWVPLLILARRSMPTQAAARINLKTLRAAAALLHDFFAKPAPGSEPGVLL